MLIFVLTVYVAASCLLWQCAGTLVELRGASHVRSIEGAGGLEERTPLHLDVAGRMCTVFKTRAWGGFQVLGPVLQLLHQTTPRRHR